MVEQLSLFQIETRKPSKVQRECLHCGKTFEPLTKKVKQGRAKYCSRECAGHAPRRPYDQSGVNNPNWKGGISQNHYHYKKLQVERYPERVTARRKVREAIKSGKLQRQPCCICGETPSFAHHTDYNKPLDVVWYCRTHHREQHNNQH